jgi:phosphatidylserine/phosphatidylglycerophosphate/cardiolipin synthase-like enzyme
MVQNITFNFPWREANQFELLVDGERFFPAMLEAIHGSTQFLLLEMYLFESGAVANRFIDALIKAVSRGVTVHVLLDDFGARRFWKKDRARLLQAGIHLSFYNPLHYGKLRRNLFRDHRKLLICDYQVAFAGGVGIADEFDARISGSRAWHEVMVKITGPNVLDWCEVFKRTWDQWSPQSLELPAVETIPSAGSQAGHVAVSGRFGSPEIQRSFVKRIHSAERRVWMATAYFVPSWKLRRALRYAARHNVDVCLLLPGAYTDHPGVRHAGRRYYGRLLRAGVRIFEYQPRFLHAKVLLCDNWVSIGSSNVDRWNLRWNLEGNQEVEDSDFAEDVFDLLQKDFFESEEFAFEHWMRRPRYARFQEWFWGNIDMWLERLGWAIKYRFGKVSKKRK